MKKLFVSIPMKGRTDLEITKSIEKMHNIAEIFEGEPLELIDSFVTKEPPKNNNKAIWYLSQSISLLSEADVFIGISDTYSYGGNGCSIENEIANKYGIKMYLINPKYIIDNYTDLVVRFNNGGGLND